MTDSAIHLNTQRKYAVPMLLALVAAGLAGNYFNYPVFLDIKFLFGSIFAMLALQFFGLGLGTVAAALIAGSTYFLWNHPYAILIMTAEVAAAGWLVNRYRISLVLADALYWLVAGLPLAYVIHHGVMQLPMESSFLVMTKQAVNGIANALVARLIYTAFVFRSRSALITYRDLLYNLLALFALCPALILLTVESRSNFAETDRAIRTDLHQNSQHVTTQLEVWVQDRTRVIAGLAAIAETLSPAQMNARLDQARALDANFLRIGMRDTRSTVLAYSPLVDEFGKSNVGKTFPERPYIATVRQTLKPVLTEVVMGRIDRPAPIVVVVAPIVREGVYAGYINGVLSLEQVGSFLESRADNDAVRYTLLDKNNHIILSNRRDQKKMAPFERGPGSVRRFEDGMSQWVPKPASNISPIERWTSSAYVAETPVGVLSAWKLVLEQPVAPFQKQLYSRYADALALLLLILFIVLALAEFLSRRAMSTTEQLSELVQRLPDTLASGGTPVWPDSALREPNRLIGSFKLMAESLLARHQEIRQANDALEQKVAERTLALTKSEQRLGRLLAEQDAILDNELIGIARVRERVLRWTNPGLEKMLGYDPGELEGVQTRAIYPSDEAYLAFGAAAYPVLAAGNVFRAELEYLRKDGGRLWAAASGSMLERESGESLWIFVDIDERKRSEIERAKLEAQLRESQKIEALGTLAGGVAHDFNNSLATIIGNAELARQDVGAGHAALVSLDEIGKACRHAKDLVQQVLTFGRRQTLERKATTLALAVVETARLLRATLPATVNLSVDCKADVPVVLADPMQIKQVLLNLCNNALSAVQDRPGPGSIEVRLEAHTRAGADGALRPGRYACLSVKDNGTGMDAATRARIFEPFFTTKPVGKGTGLGLSVVHGILQSHEASIEVDSVPGQGSDFRIYFPAVDARAAEPEAPAPSAEPARGNGKHVLYVDDEEAIVFLMKRLLERQGFRVSGHTDPLAALEAARSDPGRYAIVVTDYNMPGMSGLELAQALSEIRPGLPIVLASGYITEALRAKAPAAGIRELIYKPNTVEELCAAVARAAQAAAGEGPVS